MFVLSTPNDTLMFRIKKEYVGQEPIYFVLSDPYEKETLLCRYLTSGEREADYKKIVHLIDAEKGSSGLGDPCLILSKVPSIEHADVAVSSYRRALEEIKELGYS